MDSSSECGVIATEMNNNYKTKLVEGTEVMVEESGRNHRLKNKYFTISKLVFVLKFDTRANLLCNCDLLCCHLG